MCLDMLPRSFLCFFTVFLCLVACHTKKHEHFSSPDGLIDEQVFVDVLTELTVIEAGYQTTYRQMSDYGDYLINDADSLFESFGVDRTQYENSMDYYSLQVSKMTEIYGKVNEKLQEKLEQTTTTAP